MAIHDQRVFHDRATGKWWVGMVLTAGGMGMGGGTPRMTREGVFFTEIGDRESPSLRIDMRAGGLLRASHTSLVRSLKESVPFDAHVPLKPANVPSAEEYSSSPFEDDEGLRWVYRRAAAPAVHADTSVVVDEAVEFVCLDDTGLRGTVRFTGPGTLGDFVSAHGEEGLRSLVAELKRTYEDVSPLRPNEGL